MRSLCALAMLVTCVAADARADELAPLPVPPPPPPARQRVFGVGSAMGAGFYIDPVTENSSTSGSTTSSTFDFALLGPTIELEYFLTPMVSLNLSVPLTNILIASAILQGVSFWSQLLAEVNVGHGAARGVFGAGFGFDYVRGSLPDLFNVGVRLPVAATGVMVPVEAGVELLTKGQGFSVKFLTRPYFEAAVGPRGDWVAGGSVLFVIALYGYATRPVR